jgi:hypothetical protein
VHRTERSLARLVELSSNLNRNPSSRSKPGTNALSAGRPPTTSWISTRTANAAGASLSIARDSILDPSTRATKRFFARLPTMPAILSRARPSSGDQGPHHAVPGESHRTKPFQRWLIGHAWRLCVSRVSASGSPVKDRYHRAIWAVLAAFCISMCLLGHAERLRHASLFLRTLRSDPGVPR